MLHIKSINIKHSFRPTSRLAGFIAGRPDPIEISLELLSDSGEDVKMLEAAMNGGTIAIAGHEMIEKIEKATEDARAAIAELALEKEYLEKKMNELQGLTKRILEDR